MFVMTCIVIPVLTRPASYATYYLCVMFFSRMTDYQNHVGCDEKSGFGFSNNALSPWYNRVRYNFGYHTAHHFFPDAHWTKLPELHAQIAEKIPPERMSDGTWTGLFNPPLIAYWAKSLNFRRLLGGVMIPTQKTQES
jgi:fatty acid desaturase